MMESVGVVQSALAVTIPELVSAVPLVTLEDWFSVAESLLEPLQLSPEILLQVLAPKLFPEAQALIYRAGVFDWETAKALLRDSCGANLYRQKNNLLNERQKVNESPAVFGERLRQAPFGINGKLTGWIPEPHLAALFICGLQNKELRNHLISLAPQSVEQAISLAAEWEARSDDQAARELISSKKTAGEEAATENNESSSEGKSCVETSDDTACAAILTIQEETYTLDTAVMGQYLGKIRAARKRRIVQDVRRLHALSDPSMDLAERKLALETPHGDRSRVRLHAEVVLPLPSGLLCTTRRPTISHVWRLQKPGRYLHNKNGNKPILTPGRWVARLCGWPVASKESSQPSADLPEERV
eukprot:Protomagalhaensia_wolfi_Nauph_80__2434@NODE_260_length_3034_cov_120_246411_g194_i0_p1_GENE_NODE_260_length_3034_cov_120_246411_g194_i0NODE_260_length_3034_cov_120_246411_g194_i0_p1_ORF_typecomplete_len359_score80_27_NODE_260_length_3034_cov_120_246411_g194_i05451621